MTQEKDKILRLIKQGESERVEFKESFDEEAIESAAAFANTNGGVVLIGVSDDGRIKGVHVGKESVREWANRVTQSAHINPRIKSLRLDGKTVVVLEVSESPVKPLPCKGRYFKRVDRSNRQMTDDDLTRTILDKVGATWDEMPDPRCSVGDLDPKRLEWFRKTCNEKGRRIISEQKITEKTLENLGLIKKDHPTRAAVLLFAKEPQRWFPSAMLKVGRFRSETLIVDDREIGGTIFDQIDAAMGYFREHLQTRFEFHGTPARDVIWEYPLDALRETVTNAVCHRDYLDVSQTQIRWHDDRLIILNPGGLMPPLSSDDLKRLHTSKPRNRKIAEMLYYAGGIEKWGGGTLAILRDCQKSGLPEPQFEEKQGGLWVTLRPRVERMPPQESPKHPPSTPHEPPHEPPIMSTEERVLAFCKIPRSREEIVKELGLSSDYVRKDILPGLIRAGRLIYTLPDKPQSRKQRYLITKKGHAFLKNGLWKLDRTPGK